MKPIALLAGALIFASLSTSPAMAETKCDYGSPDVFTFVKWEFVKLKGDMRELKLTYRNNLKRPLAWVEMRFLVDDERGFPIIVSLNTREPIPASGDAVLTAEYQVPDDVVAKFHARTPLLCVTAVDDDKGKRTHYEAK